MTDHAANSSGLRRFFWPIFGIEHKKFLPMTVMISLILFNYTIVRNMKDTLVVDAGGANIITALKLYMVLPSAVIAFLAITKLYNMFSREKVFYITVGFFIAFFTLFTTVLYPFQDALMPERAVSWLLETMPDKPFYTTLITIFQYWSFSLFYIMAELWGSVVASLLFWQFANGIVRVSEAKRFYGHFYLLANLATAFSGYVTQTYSKFGNDLPTEFERYGATVGYTCWTVAALGIVIILLYKYMNTSVINDPRLMATEDTKPKKKKKLKLSMKDSLKFIFQSKYLGLIAILVISYGVSINLVEVAWKHEIKIAFPDRSDYNHYMGFVSQMMGLATFFVILLGGYLLRLLGWRFAAVLTPIMIGATGLIFFYFFIFSDSVTPIAAYLSTSVAVLTVTFGTIQNILSKSTKYALFDPTKEMAYIPLDEESKAKGKAAVDVVGGRLGKAGGAGLQEGLKLITGEGVAGYAPVSASLVLGFVVIWIFSVFKLHKLFVAAGGENPENN